MRNCTHFHSASHCEWWCMLNPMQTIEVAFHTATSPLEREILTKEAIFHSHDPRYIRIWDLELLSNHHARKILRPILHRCGLSCTWRFSVRRIRGEVSPAAWTRFQSHEWRPICKPLDVSCAIAADWEAFYSSLVFLSGAPLQRCQCPMQHLLSPAMNCSIKSQHAWASSIPCFTAKFGNEPLQGDPWYY